MAMAVAMHPRVIMTLSFNCPEVPAMSGGIEDSWVTTESRFQTVKGNRVTIILYGMTLLYAHSTVIRCYPSDSFYGLNSDEHSQRNITISPLDETATY